MSGVEDRRGHAGAGGPQARRRASDRPFKALLAFLAFTVAAIVFANYTGIGTLKAELGKPVDIRDIVMVRAGDGTVTVSDHHTEAVIARFAPGEGGFVSGSVRGLDRQRLVNGVPVTTPYRLIRWTSGATSLSDIGTGERLYLDAFGRDNAAAFAALLEGEGT